MRTRIKICGVTRVADASAAAEAGADAIGLVFHEASPRAVTSAAARAIVDALPPFVTTVALFLDAPAERVAEVLEAVPVDLIQFHGRETPAFCRGFGRPYIKAMPLGDDLDAAAFAAEYGDARGFLVDSHRAGEAGGTGRVFDWSRYPSALAAPVVLAGGLSPDNVAAAVRATRPWGVDVSSGVESAPGLKDSAKMATFIEEVQRGQGD